MGLQWSAWETTHVPAARGQRPPPARFALSEPRLASVRPPSSRPPACRGLRTCAWESGERVADISQLAAIALALGIDPTDFVQRISARVAEVHADFDADPLPAGAFSKGDLDLAADVDPDAKADED